jgi:DNA-binding transcriptional LysR family regulator
MELRQVVYFIAVAEHRSFTKAAHSLHLSQPTLSIAIHALERDLGARLFERTRRQVMLSDAGQALLPEARRILGAVEGARAAVDDADHGLRGTVRIGLMQALPLVDVAEILARYHRQRPLVELLPRPAEGGSAALADALRAGDLDVAFVSLPGGSRTGLTITPLAAEPIRLVTRPDHPLAARATVSIHELAGEIFVDFPTGFGTRRSADMEFAKAGVDRHVCIEVSDLSTLTELVRAGLGLAALPLSLVPGRGRLAIVDIDPAPTFEVALALSSDRRPKAATRAFVDLVSVLHHGPSDDLVSENGVRADLQSST